MTEVPSATEPGTASTPARTSGGWWRELMNRRVPQYAGVYMGGGFAVLQFVVWATDRYLLSPHLPDLVLCVLALGFPGALVHAWYHGAPGPNPWCRTEKLCIGGNFIVGVAVLVLLFGHADLGRATTEVTLVDEQGAVSTRTVPKTEYRRQVALFPFTSPPGDPDATRLRDAVPWLLDMDFKQDLFVHARSDFRADLARNGGDVGARSPAVLRAVALDHRLDYFVTGRLASARPGFRLVTRLYDAHHGRVLAESDYSGRSLFALVDSASLRVRRDLGIPAPYLDTAVDLPVEELTTSDTAALVRAVTGEQAMASSRQSWHEAAADLRGAVRHDPTFAAAWASLATAYLLLNEADSARLALNRAMPLIAALPEPRRTELKAVYFTLQGDRTRVLRLRRMQVELHPDDSRAHEKLARDLEAQGEWEASLSEYRKVLDLYPDDPEAPGRMAAILVRLDRPKEAIAAYEPYVRRHPDDPGALVDLARIRRSLGELKAAAGLFEQARVLQPTGQAPLLGLADIARRTGAFGDAFRDLDQARTLSSDPGDRRRVAMVLSDLYRLRGQVDSARAALTRAFGERSAVSLVNEVLSVDLEAAAGQEDEARRRLRAVEDDLRPPWDRASSIGELLIRRRAGDAAGTERALGSARGALDFALGSETFQYLYLAAEGDLARWKGDCGRAVPLYRRSLEADPEQSDVRSSLAACLLRGGESDAARATLRDGLALVPADPVLHVAMARLENSAGHADAAREELRRALDVWRDADPDFVPAREARELLSDLSGGS